MAKSQIFYIVRHGQTDYNKKGIIQGSGVDSDLNETGQKQAQAFFEHYQDVKFENIFTSALKRTHQSLQGFIDKGYPHTIDEGFNEISWGDNDGNMVNNKTNRLYWDSVERWQKGDISYSVEGAESPQDVYDRVSVAFDRVVNKGGAVNLICMHGRALRILMSYILQTPLKDMDEYKHSNLGLYLVEKGEEGFKLLKKNDLNHASALNDDEIRYS